VFITRCVYLLFITLLHIYYFCVYIYIYISIGLCYDFSLVDKLLSRADVQIALGVKGITWQDCNRDVNKKTNMHKNNNMYTYIFFIPHIYLCKCIVNMIMITYWNSCILKFIFLFLIIIISWLYRSICIWC
jgi:hypothetical protein